MIPIPEIPLPVIAKSEAKESPDASSQDLFSRQVIERATRPAHIGRMDRPDGCSAVCGWCGEVMEFYLRLNGRTIADVTFMADGCISTMACGDMLAEMAQGLPLDAAGAITPQQLQDALGGLPYANIHCSELAVSALREAMDDARRSQDKE
jgi:nitrogen fixation NifU-like protein